MSNDTNTRLPKVLNKDGSWNGDRMLEYHHDIVDTRDIGDFNEYCLLIDKNGYIFEEVKHFDYFLALECYYKRQR